jgi:hypothetical protein
LSACNVLRHYNYFYFTSCGLYNAIKARNRLLLLPRFIPSMVGTPEQAKVWLKPRPTLIAVTVKDAITYTVFNANGLKFVQFNAKCGRIQCASFIRARQLSGNVPADAGLLRVTAAGSWDTIKGTHVTDVPVKVIMEAIRRTNVITVIKRVWHLRVSEVGIATGKQLNWRVSVAYWSKPLPNLLWGRTNVLFSRYRGPFTWGYAAG